MAPVLQCMALFPCNRFPWKYSLCHALNFTNELEVDAVITTGFLPLQYSNKPLACNKYIANIIAVELFFVLADQKRFLREKDIEMANPVMML